MGAEFQTHGNVARSQDAATVLIDSDKRNLLKFRLSKMYLKLSNSVEGLLHQLRNSMEWGGRRNTRNQHVRVLSLSYYKIARAEKGRSPDLNDFHLFSLHLAVTKATRLLLLRGKVLLFLALVVE